MKIGQSRNTLVLTSLQSLTGIAPTIRTYTDFTDTTFWAQAEYYKAHPDLTDKERNICLRLLTQFYRYLVNEHTDHHYFGNSLHLSEALLFSPAFVTQIEQGFYVVPFDQHADYHNRKRMIFLLRGYSSLSTKIKDDDFMSSLSEIWMIATILRSISPRRYPRTLIVMKM